MTDTSRLLTFTSTSQACTQVKLMAIFGPNTYFKGVWKHTVGESAGKVSVQCYADGKKATGIFKGTFFMCGWTQKEKFKILLNWSFLESWQGSHSLLNLSVSLSSIFPKISTTEVVRKIWSWHVWVRAVNNYSILEYIEFENGDMVSRTSLSRKYS